MENIDRLKKEVFGKQKTLANIYQENGQSFLSDYVLRWGISEIKPATGLMSALNSLLAGIYGKDEASKITEQVRSQPLVSTIDHHGIFGHSFFLNSNLLFSLRPETKYLPVFATSGISLNNSSWPGCLVLTDSCGKLIRLSFFNDQYKTKTVFSAKKIGRQNVENILGHIQKLDFLDEAKKSKLTKLVSNVFLSAKVLERQTFSDQACLINQMFWTEVFPEAPKLIYLPLEDLVARVIIKDIVSNPEHVLYKLLFSSYGRDLAEKYFIDLKGAFGQGHGSFLFWGATEDGHRLALTREILEKDYSASADKIAEDLNKRKIYPTSLVCFLVMLYYNLNCLGGFNQTSWLTEIKEKFVELLKEMKEEFISAQVSQTIANNFAETPVAFSSVSNILFKPSLLDLYLNNVNYASIIEQAGKITLGQSLETELPEIYRIVVSEMNRVPELSAITPGEIAQNNGLTKNLSLL